MKKENVSAPVNLHLDCGNLILTEVNAQMKIDSQDSIIADITEDMLPTVDLFGMHFFSLTHTHISEPPQSKPQKILPNPFQMMIKKAENP